MKFVVIVTIVFIVVAAAYAAPPQSAPPTDGAAADVAEPTTAAKPIPAAPATATTTTADKTADGNTNSHKTFGDVYDTAADFFKRLFNKNWQLFCIRYTQIAVGFIFSLTFFTLFFSNSHHLSSNKSAKN